MFDSFSFALIQAKVLLIMVVAMLILTIPFGAIAFRTGKKGFIILTWAFFAAGLLCMALYLLLYVGWWIAWAPLLPILVIVLIFHKK
ncbi:MAG: hypothetical protein WCQ97_05170 [Aminobacterium sp.]|jgi:hypothetical protein|uniref:hypothetical protein n=1 Tax=unclassified Aminobacterium TaxID=2685012 RepID=UPI001BD0EA67|nr:MULTISPECIES: hypothetical protein [unclassified Aminobacterium]MDD2206559.1 hypothetical protein [Aminobacterium sp.]MDD3426733.1 hypothetical protein [Aminobacterium sp.]MDD3707355.1 hypothetical protein [Aminobacterium sp.]MDD4228478.1 hypothetical protein [Aminobacterium sp.]MDD4551401.1 hypothetical protein [Aminobacterium sp.]